MASTVKEKERSARQRAAILADPIRLAAYRERTRAYANARWARIKADPIKYAETIEKVRARHAKEWNAIKSDPEKLEEFTRHRKQRRANVIRTDDPETAAIKRAKARDYRKKRLLDLVKRAEHIERSRKRGKQYRAQVYADCDKRAEFNRRRCATQRRKLGDSFVDDELLTKTLSSILSSFTFAEQCRGVSAAWLHNKIKDDYNFMASTPRITKQLEKIGWIKARKYVSMPHNAWYPPDMGEILVELSAVYSVRSIINQLKDMTNEN